MHQAVHRVLDEQAGQSAEAALELLESASTGSSAPPVRSHFSIDSAHRGRDGVKRVAQALEAQAPYAAAFVNLHLPGWDGLRTAERLWQIDPRLQIVFCSAPSDDDWTAMVDRLGRSDRWLVLSKPLQPIEILQCATALGRKWENERMAEAEITRLENAIADQTNGIENATRQLHHLTTHDPLTGMPNRLLLNDRLNQAIARADRDQSGFAVMVCDLDRFKRINDSMGRRAGDDLLQEVARRWTTVARNADTVARIGGDEFVLVAASLSDARDALQLAARAIKVLEAPIRIDGIDVHTSPSVGIAIYPTDGCTVDALLAHADAAMYAAKQRGRGHVERYVRGMRSGDEDRVQLESELHAAIGSEQFELHYQPKVDTRTGEVRSAEALIRWQHPKRGMVPPTEFIPLAEECGLIGDIGEWVIREACRQVSAWQHAGAPSLRVSVNISAPQFRDSGLVDSIRRALDDSGIDACHLEAELTESAVMTDPEQSVRILEQLSAMGVVVSVDDFGTGYSSMSYLRRFPIDKLKIDRIFINEIASSSEDASIVCAIISLAHSLKLKVVAEGVETPAQLDFLRTAGCDEYQGYLFSRPLPAAAFERLLRESRAQTSFTEEDAIRTHSKLAAYRRK